MRIHVTAVAGTAMGPLAGLLRTLGHEVTGSDTAFYPPLGPALREWGIELFDGFSAENLEAPRQSQALDAVIIGNVCRADNVEAVRAEQLGIPRLHVADALQRFVLPGTSPLVVSGTHGKTTTSSLCAHLLDRAGLEPGFLIGGIPLSFPHAFRAAGKRKLSLGSSQVGQRGVPFVLEGDEYDTAFWEKSPKMLHYQAQVAILTSIEHDHIDIYPTYENYVDAFARFIQTLPSDGLLIACASDPEVVRLTQKAPCSVAYYALEGEDTQGVAPHWLAAPALEAEEGISFDLFAGGVLAGRYLSPLPGLHNLKNVTAALAACAQGYGVPLHSLFEPLTQFPGVKRRQELRGVADGVRVVEDFAHHPTAVRVTLEALRKKYRTGKLLVLFEPRSATACRRIHQEAYAQAFDAADLVLFAPVGRPDLPEAEKLDTAQLARELLSSGRSAHATGALDELASLTLAHAQPGDTVVALSNGAFGGIYETLLNQLAARAAARK